MMRMSAAPITVFASATRPWVSFRCSTNPGGEVGEEMWRLRGLAVLPDQQGKGYGSMLMKTIQAIVGKRGSGLWAQVHMDVAGYCQKHGFVEQGEAFDLKGRGPHVLMTWRPKP